MKLSWLFDKAGIDYPQKYSDIDIKDIKTDSRRVMSGDLFICIKGLHSDGHDYIEKAINSGAKVIVAERVRDDCVGGAAIIKVENARAASSLLYNARYNDPCSALKVIGVTGTNGKTSTSYMLEAIFGHVGERVGLIGTVGYRFCSEDIVRDHSDPLANMTTPDPQELYALMSKFKNENADRVVMEVSSHSLALKKVEPIRFECSVFTNLSRDHLDFHKNMEDYFLAKAEILKASRKCVVNIDDAYGKRLVGFDAQKCVTCSQHGDADYVARDFRSLGIKGIEYTLICKAGSFCVRLSLIGDFALKNSLQALATAIECGIDPQTAIDVLAEMPQICGRMELAQSSKDTGINVIFDYAHTPDALEKALISLHRIRKDDRSRIILVFGCGGERDKGKRKQMAMIASRLADMTVITSDNSRSEDPDAIISDILKGIDKEKAYKVVPKRRDAILFALAEARVGDFALIAGKGHERYEIDSSGKHPFDERDIVASAMQSRKIEDGEKVESRFRDFGKEGQK